MREWGVSRGENNRTRLQMQQLHTDTGINKVKGREHRGCFPLEALAFCLVGATDKEELMCQSM